MYVSDKRTKWKYSLLLKQIVYILFKNILILIQNIKHWYILNKQILIRIKVFERFKIHYLNDFLVKIFFIYSFFINKYNIQ